jgi:hypothetical protein
MSVTDPVNPYMDRSHVWDAWEELYWGLVGYTDENSGDLADLNATEIYNHVASYLSARLNGPAPIDEIAAVIAITWEAVQNSYLAACVMIGQVAADKQCLSVVLRLEEAWLLVDVETRTSMPREYRVIANHVPVYWLRVVH